ncbi:MAG TPA: hypothetical protein VFJ06_13795 [Halococcus sp.]|nr:hypothetical protein [Halococcus sp.]
MQIALLRWNTATGQFDSEELRAALEDDHEPESENLAGIADYYHHVHTDPAFETVLVPIGEGVTVSVRL